MTNGVVTLDISFAKNALFVRQTIAVAFGIPLDQEFTWPILYEKVRSSAGLAEAREIHVNGPYTRIPDEERLFSHFLHEIGAIRPDIRIMIRIC